MLLAACIPTLKPYADIVESQCTGLKRYLTSELRKLYDGGDRIEFVSRKQNLEENFSVSRDGSKVIRGIEVSVDRKHRKTTNGHQAALGKSEYGMLGV